MPKTNSAIGIDVGLKDFAILSVGTIAAQNPEVIPETIEDWAFGDHLWLRRTALLFQLKYKQKTDEKLLYRYIIQNASDREFFIQKAIGWALREYSKTRHGCIR